MQSTRRFRMSTSFYMPDEEPTPKVTEMRRYLNSPDCEVSYPTITMDRNTRRVTVDFIVEATTWVEAGEKSDTALNGALAAAKVSMVIPDTAENLLDNSVKEMALV